MPHFVKGVVDELIDTRVGLQKVRVSRVDGGNGNLAYALTDVIGEVAVGDVVVLNVTAVELSLGTGGWHMIHWNLSRDEFRRSGPGHVMKARYTSAQLDSGASEELLDAATSLDGRPVVASFLLSQAAVAILAYRRERPTDHVSVVVTDQASLPVAFSDLLAAMRGRGIVDSVISCGQAFGGDLEAVNVASGLGLAAASGSDVMFVTEGPGVVGTGSKFGFSAFEMAGIVDLVHKMQGSAYLAIRYSDADTRDRHRGVSHHTRTVLEYCEKAVLAVPAGEPGIEVPGHSCVTVDVGDVGALIAESGLGISSMGRSFEDDPKFFQYAAAAGVAAARR